MHRVNRFNVDSFQVENQYFRQPTFVKFLFKDTLLKMIVKGDKQSLVWKLMTAVGP